MARDKELGEMCDDIDTAGYSDADLSSREEVSSEGNVMMCHDDRANDAAKSSSNTEGAQFERVKWIFVEGKKVRGSKRGGNCFGEVTVKDDLYGFSERVEMDCGGVIGVVVRVSACM